MITPLLKPKQKEGKLELSPRELAKERKRRWEAGERTCHLCNKYISFFSNYCLDHVEPASGVGAKRDSRPENMKPAHIWPCNAAKGSRRNYGLGSQT